MKKVLATMAEWFAIVGVLVALVGFVFPPAGMWRYDGWSEKDLKSVFDWDWLGLGDLFSSDGSVLAIVALVVMVLTLLTTIYFAVVFKVSKKPLAAGVLFVNVLLGILCVIFLYNTLIANPANHTYISRVEDMKAAFGSYIFAAGYLLMAVGAVLALVVAFMKEVPEAKAE